MNDVALEKKMVLPHVILHIKAIVRNVFNEEYESVLARPMPGINYTLSLGIVPLFY
jgi:iron complex outermembrane receptor protein